MVLPLPVVDTVIKSNSNKMVIQHSGKKQLVNNKIKKEEN